MSKYPNPDDLPELDEIPFEAEEPLPEEEEAPPVEEEPDGLRIHHLETICDGCRVSVRLNDLPMMALVADDPDQPEWYAPPANPYLVGSDNTVEVSVMPLGEPEDPRDALEKAEIEVAVRHFGKGEAVAPGSGPTVFSAAVHEELRERIQESREREAEGDEEEEFELPQTFVFLFDTEGPEFAAELRDAEPHDDEAALRDYAIHIRDISAAGNATDLVAEMEPKLQAYAHAYDETRDAFHANLFPGLRDEFLPLGIEAAFERDDVELESCCGGRVWALRRPGGLPLLQTPPTEEGDTSQMEIFVAPREGELRIVR